MLLITCEDLKHIVQETVHSKKAGDHVTLPVSEARLQAIEAPLNAALREFGIDTNYRIAAFLANAIVESDHLRTFQEYASGAAYEGRADLGNTQKGDGKRFRGRGIIQVTGRTNYQACGDYFRVDLTSEKGAPTLLATDWNLAIRSGGWFWTTHVKPNLNTYADMGPTGFAETVHRVNGAVLARRTHWAERVKYYKRALEALCMDVPGEVPSDHSRFHPKHRAKRRPAAKKHAKT